MSAFASRIGPLAASNALQGLWCLWLVVWIAAGAASNSRTGARAPASSRVGALVLLAAGALIFSAKYLPSGWDPPISGKPVALWSIGFIATALGLALALWSRITLGRLWSGSVVTRRDHQLIVRGPYRFVRHPIYSGILLAIAGSTLALNRCLGVAGFVVVVLAIRSKAALEERILVDQYGLRYISYSARVPAFFPRLIHRTR